MSSTITQTESTSSEIADAETEEKEAYDRMTSETGYHSSTSSKSQQRQNKQIVLRLKVNKKPTVTWTEETVDNEHMGKKNSKRTF